MADEQTKSKSSDKPTEYPLRFIKRPTGERDWNTAKGVWQDVVHGETGEPASEYVLLATIDGVDVPIASYNAGRLETIVRSQQQAQQSPEG